MKRILICLLTLAFLMIPLSSCATAPTAEELAPRVEELLEGASTINYIFYGVGLPVENQSSDYSDKMGLYVNFEYEEDYDILSQYAEYTDLDDILETARLYYSDDFVDGVLNQSMFVGYALEDGIGEDYVSAPRYMEEEDWIYVSRDFESYYQGDRIYDYDTIEVEKQSTEERCTITLMASTPDAPDTYTRVRVTLVKENGVWMLDSFSG